MWKAHTKSVPSGLKYRILQRRSPVSFRELFHLLEIDSDFAQWYARTLADCTLEAFFWEHPPLTTDTFDDEAEFVLIESPTLASLRPEPAPFESQFARNPGADVITFPNLGGDALLVVPKPLSFINAYTHFATFVRNAPETQVRSLLKVAAQELRENLSTRPRWLSTAGLGVSWLHLRLDTTPKYYSYAPYTAVA